MTNQKALEQKSHQTDSTWNRVFKRHAWIWMLLIIFVFVNIINKLLSPYYDVSGFLYAPTLFLDKAFLALSMSFVLVIGYIDISVASIVALSSVSMGVAFNAGLPMPLAIVLCIVIGIACGLLNGVILSIFTELAPMIITLATQIIYRGIASIMLEDGSAGGFPAWYNKFFGSGHLVTIVFVVCAFIFFLTLQKTRFGRELYAMGNNMTTSRFSGIPVGRNIILVFVLNGLMAAMTAIFLTARMTSTRPNIAMSYEMDVIAMVVFGGISTAGGKGTLLGVIISIFTLGYLRYGLELADIAPTTVNIIIGILLIVAVALPQILTLIQGRKKKVSIAK